MRTVELPFYAEKKSKLKITDYKKDNKFPIKVNSLLLKFADKILFPKLAKSILLLFIGKRNVNIYFGPDLFFMSHFFKYQKSIDVMWNIDFSPKRFDNKIINWLYNKLDYYSFKKSNLQIDLTSRASEARSLRHKLDLGTKNLIVPIGISNPVNSNFYAKEYITFIGNLQPNQNVKVVIRAYLDHFIYANNFKLLIIGDGPEYNDLQEIVANSNHPFRNQINFTGNLDQIAINEYLEKTAICLAPYSTEDSNFSHYADPSKIKKYISHCVPIVMTNVSYIAKILSDKKCAIIVEETKEDFGSALNLLASDINLRNEMSSNLLLYAKSISWRENLMILIKQIGNLESQMKRGNKF